MKVKWVSIFVLVISSSSLNGQLNWDLHLGINHSNLIHTLDGQQILYAHTLNAPHWNIGFQIGISKEIYKTNIFSFNIGTRIQLKGDKNSLASFSTPPELTSLRLMDLMIPANILIRVLNGKDIFFKSGLSGNLMIYEKKIADNLRFFKPQSFGERLGLSGHFGINFKTSNKLALEIMYSQSLFSIDEEVAYGLDGSLHYFYFKHQAFEISILYTL